MEEGGSSRGDRKRSFVEDDDSNKPPPEKRVRFPKGKKVKQGDSIIESASEDIPGWKNPRIAAQNRSARRSRITADLLNDENNDVVHDIRRAEVQYEENETFVEEGVPIEPFNLDKEREEGYFDENGNYVEYMNQNVIKDAWLDSVDTYQKHDGKSSTPVTRDDKPRDLTTEELAEMNRRIADVLEPGETVLRGLRRLKGSTDKKQKMSAETKQLFDQLTEDAMKLMENGDYNVYDEKQEHFEREAEGYEKLVNARKHGVSDSGKNVKSDDMFDMFGDDDGNTANTAPNGSGTVSAQPSESEALQNDYAYDEASGYYYSSSLGYYYDPSTGLYCCAASGQWYSYNEESGAYDEIQQATADANIS